MRRTIMTIVFIAACTAPALVRAAPPEIVNYQGVLRDSSDVPLDGTHDMTFAFYSASAAGDQILIDEHTLANGGQVTVSGGLFNVALGGGAVSDGLGPGLYTRLSEVFRDYGEVWLEIDVNGETLAPRVRIVSSPYAHNAVHLNGKKASEYLDTSSGAQTKLGDLTVSDLTVNGGHVYLGSNGTIRGSADRTEILGDAGSDDLYLLPGTILNSGRIALWGNSEMELRAGNGVIRLFNGSTGVQTAIFGNVGDLDIADDLTVGGDRIEFTSGGQLYNTPTLLSIYGNNPTGTTRLGAGTLTTHGSIEIAGQSYMRFEAGNGEFHFRNGMAAEERASLGANGDLQIDGDLTADGDHQYLGGGETTIYSGAGVTSIYGNAPSDLLRLVGGHDLNTSYIEIHGAGDIDFLTDSGSFRFRVADTDVEVASLNSSGDLRIDGGIDLTDGATIWTTGSPATLTFGGTNLDLYLGDSSADNARVPGNLYVTGTKDFVQNHPEREDLSIHYTALEGDESGTYTRGSGRLEGGVARVQLGETFAWVTNPDVGLTAQVTARGGEAPLWVESISTTDLVVRCDDARCADAAFDYVVQGLRIGYEDKPVVRPKRMEAAVPPPGYFAEERSVADAVGSRTALERFEREHRGVWGELPPTEERRAAELRAAIGVHAYGDAVRERLPGGGEEDGSPGFRSASATRTAGAETGLPDTVADPAGSGGASAIGEATVASTAPASELRARSFRSEMPAVATSVTVAVPVEPGTVLAIDPHRPGVLRIADSPEDPAVFGVTLGEAGLVLDTGGAFPSEEATTVESERFEVAVAVAGVARCRVDAGYGSIRPGDLLVASPTPGRAMRAADPVRGAVIGKALEPLETGTGAIRMLVLMR